MEDLYPDFDSSPYKVHAITFNEPRDTGPFSLFVGKEPGYFSTWDENIFEKNLSWRCLSDNLDDGLRIIREFCQDSELKHLRFNCRDWFPKHTALELWRELMRGLQDSTSIKLLEIIDIPNGLDLSVRKIWMEPMVQMLNANSSLLGLKVNLRNNTMDAELLVRAVSNNRSLKLLEVWATSQASDPEAWGLLMASLTPDSSGTQTNMALRDLRVNISLEYDEAELAVSQMVTMLKANRTLTSVVIPRFVLRAAQYIQVLQALHLNRCVRKLLLQGHITKYPLYHDHVLSELLRSFTDDVFSELLSLVKNNYWLTTVDGYEGDSLIFREVEAQLEINRSINNYARPTSCRVFLCGFPEAGKTTLRNGIERIFKAKAKTFHLGYSVAKRFEILHKPVSERTKGVQVVSTNAGSVKLSIWDMGGQDEFHAFHDLVIPNLSDTGSASLFILVCALAKEKDEAKSTKEIDDELRYWLRFLSSNSRASEYLRPHVIMVFTFVDYLPKSMNIESHVEELLKDVKDTFAESCHFSSTEYFLTSHSTRQVIPLAECLAKDAADELAKVPDVYQECVQMEEVVSQWRKERPYEILIKWVQFLNLFQLNRVKDFETPDEDPQHVQDICKVVALELNKGGHIIFFEGMDVVVMDPNWFGTRIIGPIFSISPKCIDAFTKEPITNVKGYTDKERLKSVLENSFNVGQGSVKKSLKAGVQHVALEDVIHVMTQMSICYEEQLCGGEEKKKGVFIPATLRDEGGLAHDGKRKLNWNVIATSSTQEMCYIGRRLQCEDPVRTFLSTGFFPRLQVVFEGKFGSRPTFRLEKNLVAFTENGMQVLVEQSGDLISDKHVGGFIDVMVQSTKDAIQTLQFVRDEVMKPIRTLCAKPAFGCQGVTLAESILRPACVEELWLCTDRREQAISEKKLLEEVFAKQDFEGYVHHWPLNPIQSDDHRGDKVQALLGELAWSEKVVNRRIANMVELTNDLMHDQGVSIHVLPNATEEPGPKELKPITSLQSLYAQLTQEMRQIVERKGDEVVDRVNEHMDEKFGEMRAMLSKLKMEISKDVDRVINHSVHSQQRQVPCYVYVTTDDLGTGEWLISSLVPGMKSAQLHLMCEHKGSIHKVDEQEGVALRLESKALSEARPYVIWGLRIITMLMKVGANVAAGLGSMVPDLEKSLFKGVASVIPSVASDILGKESTPSEQVNLMRLKDQISEHEKRTAEQWLVNFLAGKDIQRLFGLQRICYTDGSNEFAWVCQKHVDEGRWGKKLELCPVGSAVVT